MPDQIKQLVRNEQFFYPKTISDAVVFQDDETLTIKFNKKQDLLVSGENIKTLHGQSILGSGDLSADGSSVLFYEGYFFNNGERESYNSELNSFQLSANNTYYGGIVPKVSDIILTFVNSVLVIMQCTEVINNSDYITVNKIEDVDLKGQTGLRGPVGVESAEASVDKLPGTPRVVVSVNEGVLTLAFYGLKGMQGNPGMNNARQMVVTELPTAGPETADIVYLVQIDNTNEYKRYITQYDGTNYSWVQIGTTEMTLDDYIRKDDILFFTEDEIKEIEVFDTTKYYVTYEDEEI